MPKAVHTDAKGLVQSSGTGFRANSGFSLGGVQSLSAPAAAEGSAGASNLINEDASVIIVSNANNANDRIYLPDPAKQPAGKLYLLIATEAFELSSLGTSISINDEAVSDSSGDFAAELAITAQTIMICIKQSDTVWRVGAIADGGAPG
jgi:hypothetical protein